MAKQARSTFGAISSTLQSLGFVRSQHGQNIVFTHPNGSPVIALPSYQPGQAMQPIHRMMVKKQLTDAGLLNGSNFPLRGGGISPRIKAPNRIRLHAPSPGKLTISGLKGPVES